MKTKKPEDTKKKSEPNHSNRAHARIAPSSLKPREVCPGYRSSQSKQFKAWSDEGTAMHEAVEKGDAKHLDGHELMVAINTAKIGRLPHEQQASVQVIIDYIAPIIKSARVVKREYKIPIAPEYGVDFGTVDLLAEQKDFSIDLGDWKFGLHPVDPADTNAQFACGYVIGVFRNYPKCNTVRVHILQPRVSPDADVATFERKDLKKLELRLATIIARMETFDNGHDLKMLKPTYDGCLYCGRKGSCPKLANFALQISPHAHAQLVIPKMPFTVEACKKDPQAIARLKDLGKVMKEWAEAVDAHALEFVTTESIDLPGFALRNGRGGRYIPSALLAVRFLEDMRQGPTGEWYTGEQIEAMKPTARKQLGGNPPVTSDEFLSLVSRVDFDAFDKLIGALFQRSQKGKGVEAFVQRLTDEGVIAHYAGKQYLQRLRRSANSDS